MTPSRYTRRVPTSIRNSTYTLLSVTVSTLKKSIATVPAACAGIRAGKITLAAAQTGIATDWIALGRQLGLSLPGVK